MNNEQKHLIIISAISGALAGFLLQNLYFLYMPIPYLPKFMALILAVMMIYLILWTILSALSIGEKKRK